jgi:hypothetical protein
MHPVVVIALQKKINSVYAQRQAILDTTYQFRLAILIQISFKKQARGIKKWLKKYLPPSFTLTI